MMRIHLLALLVLLCTLAANACTSAIVSGRLTANGRPLLWKNRDTDDQNNRLKRFPAADGNYAFVALFDARDRQDTAAWMGYNQAGFAIMNTASYNINHDTVPARDMDKEGVLMKAALQRCATVDDFERLLAEWPRPRGVEANFGVIDALGHGAYFETGNYTCVKYDLADAPDGILMRTNYSRSGTPGKGFGYIREGNEQYLLKPHIALRDFTPAVFTEELSRTFYHSLLGQDFTHSGQQWLVDQDFIPRRISTASMVIEGVRPGEDASLTTMWVALGYPPCADVFYVHLGQGGLPVELTGTTAKNHAVQCDTVLTRKAQVFPVDSGNGQRYLRLDRLYNAQGTGWCQRLLLKNMETYRRGYQDLERRRQALAPKGKQHGRRK